MNFDLLDESYQIVKSILYFEQVDQTSLTSLGKRSDRFHQSCQFWSSTVLVQYIYHRTSTYTYDQLGCVELHQFNLTISLPLLASYPIIIFLFLNFEISYLLIICDLDSLTDYQFPQFFNFEFNYLVIALGMDSSVMF